MDDDLAQVSDEQLQATLQARQQETVQKAAATPLPDRSRPLSELSDEELQTAAMGHQLRNEQLLAPVRQQVARDYPGESTGRWMLRNAVGAIRQPVAQILYGRSKKALSEGTAGESDLKNIAIYEQEQQRGSQESVGTALGGAALSLPGQAALLFGGGAAAKAITPAALAANPGVLAGGARLAIQAAVTPNLAPEAVISQNVEHGRDPFDVRGIPVGAAKSLAELVTIEGIGKLTKAAFPTSGVVGRTAVSGLSGPFAQAGADAVSYGLGLNTRYGAVQDFAEGKYGQAAKRALTDVLSYGALGAMHGEPEAGKKLVADAVKTINAQAAKGQPAPAAVDAARRQAADAGQRLIEAATQNGEVAQDALGRVGSPEAQNPAEAAPVQPGEAPGSPAAQNATLQTPPIAQTAQTPRERVAALESARDQAAVDVRTAQRKGLTGAGQKKKLAGILKDLDAARNEAAQAELPAERVSTADGSAFSGDSGVAPSPESSASPERRVDAARRKRVAEMTPEERSAELLTSKRTGLPNDRAYEESDRKEYQAFADADGLKQLNDRFGHDAGDALLRAVGDAFKAEGVPGFHLSGDEFAHEHNDPAALHADMKRVQDRLAGAELTFQDSQGKLYVKKGVGLSYGVAKTLPEAEGEAGRVKVQREQAGQRELRSSWEARFKADPRSLPGGVSELAPAGREAGQREAGAAAQAPVVEAAARPEVGPTVPDVTVDRLRAGLLSADQRLTPEELVKAGLTPREAHVAVERLVKERDQEDLRADVELGNRVYGRENVRLIEKKALAKLGIDKSAEDVIKERTGAAKNDRLRFDQEREAQLDDQFSEEGPDVSALTSLVKGEVASGSRWRVDKLKEVMGEFFTPEEVAAAFAGHKLPPRGKASDEPGGTMVGTHAQARAAGYKSDLRRHVVELLKGIAPKELADDIAYRQRRGKSRPQAESDLSEAVAEALRFAGAQADQGETAAGEGYEGPSGTFDPAEFDRPANNPAGKSDLAANLRDALRQSKDPHTRDWIEAALENAGGDPRRLAREAVVAWQNLKGAGKVAVADALRAAGVEQIGKPGERVPFHGAYHHSAEPGAFTDKPAVVQEPGWLLREPGGEHLLEKAQVKLERSNGEPRGAAVAPERIDPADPLAQAAVRFVKEEGGYLDPAVAVQKVGAAYAHLKAVGRSMSDNFAELAGRMGPRTTRLSRESGEALARYNAAGTYARLAAPLYIDKIMGEDATPAQRLLWGTAFQEMRHRYARANGSAPDAVTFVGQTNSPLKTDADYQAVLADPKFQAMLGRWKSEFVPVMEANYRGAQGLDPNDPIDSPTQIPGLPMNAKPIREGEAVPGHAITTGARGNLKNLKTRKYGFAEQAGLDADTYDTDLGAIIENTLAKGTAVARKAEMYRTMADADLVQWAKPGQTIDGFREIPFTTPPRGTQDANPGDVLYTKGDIYREVRNALDVDSSYKFFGTPILQGVTKAALASTAEATYHTKNLLTFMTKPGTSPLDLVKNGWKVLAGDQAARESLVELARIGAMKEGGFESPTPLANSKLNPLTWMGRFLDVVDRSMRLTASDAFDRLARSGRVVNTETSKRDFINQLGQYNRRAQNEAVRLLRDSGLGPFATAGSTYYMQGLRSLTGNPGAEATSAAHAVGLRAEMLARTASVLGAVALTNYLLWKRVDGDDKTPLGAIKVGENKDGRTAFWDLTNLTGLTRGMREVGLLALAERERKGPPDVKTENKAYQSAIMAALHPAIGPGVQAAYTAATGKDTHGFNLTTAKSAEASTPLEKFWAALRMANPLIGTLTGGEHPGRQVPTDESAMRLLGPFGVQYRYPPGHHYPKQPAAKK